MLAHLLLVLPVYFALLPMEGAMAAPIPQDVKKTVTFIFIEKNRGELIPNGTGFFVAVKHETDPGMQSTYLVTAQHVLKDGKGNFLSKIWIRLNKLAGGSEFLPAALTRRLEKLIYTHPDPTVDIAVVPAYASRDVFDYIPIDPTMLVTRESFREIGIGEGSEIFFVGLFTAHVGKERNYPLVRFGRVAMISGERILWRERRKKDPDLVEVFLMETTTFGGNSGSPVFFDLGVDRIPNTIAPREIRLAGVVRGSFLKGEPVQVVSTGLVPFVDQNIGISAVTPSYFLHDILLSEELGDNALNLVSFHQSISTHGE